MLLLGSHSKHLAVAVSCPAVPDTVSDSHRLWSCGGSPHTWMAAVTVTKCCFWSLECAKHMGKPVLIDQFCVTRFD